MFIFDEVIACHLTGKLSQKITNTWPILYVTDDTNNLNNENEFSLVSFDLIDMYFSIDSILG